MFRTMKNPIIYSDEFRNAVLKAYPNDTQIKELLDKNEYVLGRYLSDSSSSVISVDTVLRMIEQCQVNSLFNLAFDIKEKSKLYGMWDKECFLD
jgi:hypothetical protein